MKVSPAMPSPVLEVRNLSIFLKRGKHPLVDKINFSLESGKTTALVGESGCGKSLTSLALLGLLPDALDMGPQSEVLFNGQDLTRLRGNALRKIRGKEISMIFQDPQGALNPVFSIGYQLSEVAALHLRLFDEEGWQRGVAALSEVGIPDPEKAMEKYPHELSGGMKQRVMIAMALMCEPKVLIADEPTTALDVTIQAQVLDLIKKMQEEKGMAVLLITHDMGVVAETADSVLVMYAARIMEKGEVIQIFDHYAHPYTQALFRSLPDRYAIGEKLKSIEGFVPSLDKAPTGCRFHPRCPYVMEKCRAGVIPDFTVEAGHQTACLLHEEGGRGLKHE